MGGGEKGRGEEEELKKGGTEEFQEAEKTPLARGQKNKQNTNSGPQGLVHLKLLNMFALKM